MTLLALRRVAAAVLAVASLTACAAARPAAEASPAPTSAAPATTSTAVRPPEPEADRRAAPQPADRCEERHSVTAAADPVPGDLAASIEAALAHPGFHGTTVGVSIWVEGLGVVAEHGAGLPLLPASNQKLLTAIAALATLPHDATLDTEVRAAGSVEAGTLHGDLVVVGGGDPTLRSSGLHSLDDLARAVTASGITAVTGGVLVDESRHDTARVAEGWLDWHLPTHIGTLSAFTVDGNRRSGDLAYLVDPALHNGELFVRALTRHGMTVAGPVAHGTAPPGAEVVARLRSPTVEELVRTMLTTSDNTIAELLLREAGRTTSGLGSTEAGIRAAVRVLEELCVDVHGSDGDGSGLSRYDRRSAGEWQRILLAVRGEPWARVLLEGLPLAGRTGTLTGRFHGTPAEGVVRAKTGSIIEGRSLSGYGITAGGRPVVFSVLVNGDRPAGAVPAIDALVATVMGYTG